MAIKLITFLCSYNKAVSSHFKEMQKTETPEALRVFINSELQRVSEIVDTVEKEASEARTDLYLQMKDNR